MRVALVDYDSGNLHSAEKAFQLMGRDAGAEVVVTADPEVAARADRIVLPGDGAFPACRTALGEVDGMAEAIQQAVLTRGVPFMGICVGMQMLATTGHEYRETPGLDWIGGEIRATAESHQRNALVDAFLVDMPFRRGIAQREFPDSTSG